MSGARVDIHNIAEVIKALNLLPERAFAGAKQAFAVAVFAADAKVKANCATALHVRSGALRRSIKTSVTGMTLDSLKASLYASNTLSGKELVYATVHEFGATITAKKAYSGVPGGPYLNIPTSANQTTSGVMRMTAQEVFSRGGYVAKTRTGKYGVFQGGQMMFTLRKQVRIPARLGMRDAANAQVSTLLSTLATLRYME